MRILITGGAGFIGQRLARELLSQGSEVRILDNFSKQIHASDSLPDDLQNNVHLIKADIRDRESLKRALQGVDAVIHLAAETGTGQSMYEIEHYFSVNVQGTATLIDLLQNDPCGKDVRNFVVASSRAIYGEGAYQCKQHGQVFPDQRDRINMTAGQFEPLCPICGGELGLLSTLESAPFKPMSIYGLTKQIQEQAVLMFARTRGINSFALRYQNVYGPGQSLKNPYTGILAVFSNLARQDQPIEVYEDGQESRDFVFIDDVVKATILSVNYSGNYVGALNVGTGRGVSIMSVAQEVRDYFKSSSQIGVSGAFRVGDIRHNIADLTLINKILGFAPRVQFKEGLHQFLKWAAEQPVEDKNAYSKSVIELSEKGLMCRGAASR